MNSKNKIEDLGYTPFFEAGRNQLDLGDFSIARVISEFRGAYKVKNLEGECFAKLTGKQAHEGSSREDYPAVGDWVAITELDIGLATIQGVLPRSTVIKRKYGDKNRPGKKDGVQIIATNIDVAFIVESVDRDYNLNRFERYFVIVKDGGVKPVIILNKIDLIQKEKLDEIVIQIKNRFPEVKIILTSADNNEGISELISFISKGKTYCFLGSSGVGKSSLINKLLGEDTIKTGDISSYSDRGKHVTTGRQMYFLENGGIVIDNPGIREVGLSDVGLGIDSYFDEIESLSQKCKFNDCTHTHEKGCEVIDAVKSGKIDGEKYSSYIDLRKEAEYFEMNDVEKRKKNRQVGKFMKNAKKELKDRRRKNR